MTTLIDVYKSPYQAEEGEDGGSNYYANTDHELIAMHTGSEWSKIAHSDNPVEHEVILKRPDYGLALDGMPYTYELWVSRQNTFAEMMKPRDETEYDPRFYLQIGAEWYVFYKGIIATEDNPLLFVAHSHAVQKEIFAFYCQTLSVFAFHREPMRREAWLTGFPIYAPPPYDEATRQELFDLLVADFHFDVTKKEVGDTTIELYHYENHYEKK